MESRPSSSFLHSPKSLEQTLQTLFPEPQEENKLQKARRILGNTVSEISDEQLEVFLTEIQYLLNGFFDHYEKQLFNGMTLRQVVLGK